MTAKRTKRSGGLTVAATVILGLLTVITLFPVLLLIAGSFTKESALITYGYTPIPKEFSLDAYRYLAQKFSSVGRAYLVTIGTTVAGTLLSLLLTCSIAYPMARSTFKYRNAMAFFVYFTMLFNGGIVPAYIMWTKIFHIQNTYAALIVPNLLMSAFNVLLIRNYYRNSIPPALYESAMLDGASEFKIFVKIACPLAVPVISTVALFTALAYWNSWTNAMYYVTDPEYFGIQNYLMRIMKNIEFLRSNTEAVDETVITLPGQSIRMAIALIGILPVMVVYPLVQKYFIKGIVIGAVKE
ncbi:MAG: carbohydrate ABC transporter permease [Oscillospiraceae bacterium]|nr:carbohydrate ABC transporter permease [Oscillospiraceae bacterium]